MHTNVAAQPVFGSITVDGSLSDWTANDQIDAALSVPGYDIYAKATGGSLVFALHAPVAIGANTTVWLNTDQRVATGFLIFGFTGGAEFNVNFDVAGVPRLYTGDAGEIPISNDVGFATSADHTVVEFEVPLTAIGSPNAVNTLWDVNDTTFLPTSFSRAQYEVVTGTRQTVVGSVTLDGNLSDWTASEQIDNALSVPGYDIYGKATGGFLVLAVHSPIAVGSNTTIWLNTDQNASRGFQVFGFAGGAEYNINFDLAGTPRLYTGDAGQTLVPGGVVLYGGSLDRSTFELAVPLSAIGSPNAVGTLWDIDDSTFLPTSFGLAQYEVVVVPPPPVIGSITLDGSLGDWSAADQIDQALSVPGYDVYGKATGGALVLGLHSPVAIGANTTAWLNTDQNVATGFKIFGFAGGAEYNVNFDTSGTPQLYTGDAGQTLVPGGIIGFAASADRTTVELAVSLSAIGSPAAVNTLWDVNDATFLPTDFSLAQYPVVIVAPPAVVGTVTVDGSLAEWASTERIDQPLSVPGYDIYARVTGDAYVFALSAPVPIGANTTAWLNTDQNAATGFQIFGFAGGAEFNVNFDESGTPRLYTGNAGGTLAAGVDIVHAYSADRTVVEFAVPTGAIGSPNAINTLWDVNDSAFLPTSFGLAQYPVLNSAAAPVTVGAITIDGSIGDWSAASQVDQTLSVTGYDIYAQATGGSLVFALKAPGPIGPETTAWLNTDQSAVTGFQIFGFAGGAEFNVNFDMSGTPHLYTGNAGQTLVAGVNVPYAYSSDHTIVEFAVPLSAVGSPALVSTLWDVNNTAFLPTDFSLAQYAIGTGAVGGTQSVQALSVAELLSGGTSGSHDVVAGLTSVAQLQSLLGTLLNDGGHHAGA